MQSNELKQFLIKAKSATYASQSESAYVKPQLQDSNQLEYRDGDFLYRDIFFGMIHFIGQEVIYRSERVVWSMCYSGGLHTHVDVDSTGLIYAFLRQALQARPVDLPIRGPKIFEDNDMLYTCNCNGSFELFNGLEEITRNGERLYQLHFSGGDIL